MLTNLECSIITPKTMIFLENLFKMFFGFKKASGTFGKTCTSLCFAASSNNIVNKSSRNNDASSSDCAPFRAISEPFTLKLFRKMYKRCSDSIFLQRFINSSFNDFQNHLGYVAAQFQTLLLIKTIIILQEARLRGLLSIQKYLSSECIFAAKRIA